MLPEIAVHKFLTVVLTNYITHGDDNGDPCTALLHQIAHARQRWTGPIPGRMLPWIVHAKKFPPACKTLTGR